MRTQRLSVLVLVMVVVSATPILAAPINPSFETGNFTGWSTFGQTSVVTNAFFNVTPTDGHFEALLTTGGSAGSVAGLESFLGLSPGALSARLGLPVFQGSAIKQTFSVTPGSTTLSFNSNFLTNECPLYCSDPNNPFRDTAFSIITVQVAPELQVSIFHLLAHTNIDSADFFPAPGIGFNVQTGYDNFTIGPLFGGTGMLALGIVDVGDFSVDSALVVDASSTVVPEPSTIMLLVASLGGIAWHRRHRGAPPRTR
jgi:hypothetical protein